MAHQAGQIVVVVAQRGGLVHRVVLVLDPAAVRHVRTQGAPQSVVGVGIGGTFEKCAYLAKKALTRPVNVHSKTEYVAKLEEEMLDKINRSGIGPGGLGGSTTAFAVNIETYATHIAGLPVAVNICCHVNRHAVREL